MVIIISEPNQVIALVQSLIAERLRNMHTVIILVLHAAHLRKRVIPRLPSDFGRGRLLKLLAAQLGIKLTNPVSLLFAVDLDLLVNVLVVVFQFAHDLVFLLLFALFDGLAAIDALQKVAIFVHVEGQVIIGKRLHSLDRRSVPLHLDSEAAFEFGYVDVTHVCGVLRLVQLHVLEIVLVLEILVQPVLHLDPAEQILDPVPLLVQFELAQLVSVLACEALSEEHIKELLSSGALSFLDCFDDFTRVLAPILPHSLEVLADLIVRLELELCIDDLFIGAHP